MAKRCEICGKGPVVGRTVSHAHNVGPRRFEPNLQTRPSPRQRGDQTHARLHALSARAARSRKPRDAARRLPRRMRRPRLVLTRPPSAPETCSSSRGRFPSIPSRASLSRATSPRRPSRSCAISRALLAGGRSGIRARRSNNGVSRRPQRIRGDERRLRAACRQPAAGPRHRAGFPTAARRPDRNRRDRSAGGVARLAPSSPRRAHPRPP